MLRQATIVDIDQISGIHIDAFPGFFLTSLGPPFLNRLYRSFITEKGGCCIVAEDEGQIVGFTAGTSVPELFFPKLRKKKLSRFAWAALPGLLKNPFFVIRKCFSALFYKGEPIPELKEAALLSSLAVHPSYSGCGIGGLLVEAFIKKMASVGAASVFLTTDAIENEQVNCFYEKCGFQLKDRFFRPGKRVMNRWVKFLN